MQSSDAEAAKLLCVQFAFNTSAVLTGDDDGTVAVYGLCGFEQHHNDRVLTESLDSRSRHQYHQQ